MTYKNLKIIYKKCVIKKERSKIPALLMHGINVVKPNPFWMASDFKALDPNWSSQ